MQISKQELADAVRRAKEQNQLTEELAALGLEIARGYFSQKSFDHYSWDMKQDLLAHWALSFVKKWEKIDPEKNCFAWITYTVRSAHFVYTRSAARRIAREDKQADELLASSRDSRDNWARAIGRFRHDDDSGIVPEAEWLAGVKAAV